MTTGDRIRQARIQAGMTQKELAEKIGVKFSAISKYETGRVKNLKREDIDTLARALNVRPSWLMCMDDDSNLPVRQEIRDEMRILFSAAEDAPASALLEAAALLMRYKEKSE